MHGKKKFKNGYINNKLKKWGNCMLIIKNTILFLVLNLYFTCQASSCESYLYKQETDNLSNLLIQACDTQIRLATFITHLSVLYPNSTVSDPGIKNLKTINQLLTTRWNGNPAYITDYARVTIAVDSFHEIYRCLEDIKKSHFQVISIRDNFLLPYPSKYRDINVVIKDRTNNHLAEIQINSSAILTFKDAIGHPCFNTMRNLEANALVEKRTLSDAEQNLITNLNTYSVTGYNKAFGNSLMLQNKKLRVGIYGIFILNNKVLMTKEQSGSKMIYNFPGGGLDPDEGLADALIRECKEEIGTDVVVRDLLYTQRGISEHDDFPGSYTFSMYCAINIENPKSIKNGYWFPIDQLPLSEMLPADIELANYLWQNT